MRTVTSRLIGAVVPMLVIALGGSALAAPKSETPEFDARIEAADSSVVSNDGNADYVGRRAVATIQDYQSDASGDVFDFNPWLAGSGRTITFQHPSLEEGRHIRCDSGRVFFRSDRAPYTWWQEVNEQGSTLGQAVVHCFQDGGSLRYRAYFPLASTGGEECVSFAKTGDNTFAITAEAYVPETTSEPGDPGEPGGSGPTGIEPVDELLGGEEEPSEEPQTTPASGCPATIDVSRWVKGAWDVDENSEVTSASAPFILELTLRA